MVTFFGRVNGPEVDLSSLSSVLAEARKMSRDGRTVEVFVLADGTFNWSFSGNAIWPGSERVAGFRDGKTLPEWYQDAEGNNVDFSERAVLAAARLESASHPETEARVYAVDGGYMWTFTLVPRGGRLLASFVDGQPSGISGRR